MSCRACERAYQMLETLGVPRKRAGEVANGIDVLSTRYRKEVHAQQAELTRLRAFFAAVARMTLNHRVHVTETPDFDSDFAWVSPADLGHELQKIEPNWTERIQTPE